MPTVQQLADFLEMFAPSSLAESWDNVGLLVGDGDAPVERLMTCLTITPTTVREAIREQVDLVVTHHPLPFRPLKQLTRATPEGQMLLQLISAHVAIYSPHTAFDSARAGINQQIADGLGLQDIHPLVPASDDLIGTGRYGETSSPVTLHDLATCVRAFFNVPRLSIVGTANSAVRKVGIACGSAGDLLGTARDLGCQAFVTGEVRFHTALEAEATGIALVQVGHYASERFAVETLSRVLSQEFDEIDTWCSRDERDPFQIL